MINSLLWFAILSAVFIACILGISLIRSRFYKKYSPISHFSVAVIIPCKGNDDPHFENNLLKIIQQAYDGSAYFVLCAESESDAATPILRRLAERITNARVCIAGLATRASQKAWNVLHGMMSAADNVDIFVIADADIQPHARWLQEMLGPFSDARIGAATGFFRRVPTRKTFQLGDYVAGLFGAFMGLSVAHDAVKGLWGGSLAIRKEVVEQCHIYELLATEMVDDITIMHALHAHGVERRFVPGCISKSYCDMSVSDSIRWLVRQMQFIQVYFKGLYAFLYLITVPLSFSAVIAPLLFLHGVVNVNGAQIITVMLFMIIVLMISLELRFGVRTNPETVLPGDCEYQMHWWLLATPLAFICASIALFNTLRLVKGGVLTMRWRGVEYRVDVKTGKVLEVIRADEPAV